MNASGTYDEVYYYDEYDLIAKEDSEGKKFYHPDHLGSTTLVTDEQGNVVEETVYDPYGAVQEGGDQRFDYEGKETDFSGLQYFGARYYDPGKPKRWTQPDTLLPDVYDPQQLNRYAFERNNPYKNKDPDGHNPVLIAYFVWKVYGAVLTVTPIIYRSIKGDIPSWENSLFVMGDVALDTLVPISGDISIALNTNALISDPDSYIKGEGGFTYAGYLEEEIKKIKEDNDEKDSKDKQKVDGMKTYEVVQNQYISNRNTNTNDHGQTANNNRNDDSVESKSKRDEDFMSRWRAKHQKPSSSG